MNNRGQMAKTYFLNGYNCAQAVLLSFGDMTGLDEQTAALIASSFGGGMARMREVCGAVSGGAMVLGLLRGYADPRDAGAKKAHYERVRAFAGRFKEENGSIICRELLAGVGATTAGDPEPRTSSYYKKRPCPELIALAAEILDDMLTEG